MSDAICELIVYACPRGPLAEQMNEFYAESRAQYGANTAHSYPPHITLTGFFHDQANAIPRYCSALEAAQTEMLRKRPEVRIRVTELRLSDRFHGLLIRSSWLEELTAMFASGAISPTRRTKIRLKNNLHLSLAYDFLAEHGPGLADLAQTMVDPAAPVEWVLGLYERRVGEWLTHWERDVQGES